MSDRPAEKVGKNEIHDQQHQQRREDAPQHTENGTFVLGFEVAFHQLFKQKFMFRKHRQYFHFITTAEYYPDRCRSIHTNPQE